ncbi:MAG: DUF3488 and transglutaminase-like domain-containing protein, partial [Nevskiaceae bacterium]|nr:DUF3488 and transglutaminase-like domain-containing protein [Nevskiaceae bacterium]
MKMQANSPLPAAALRLVLAAYGIAMLLHVDRVPIWCSIAALTAMLWRIAHQRGRLRLPGGITRNAAALLLTAAILMSFRSLGGLSAGSALLMMMGALKLLEMRARRDAVVIVLVSFVLLLAACLDRGGLLRVPLYVVSGWTGCAALSSLGHRHAPPLRQSFAEAGSALLWALPLTVVLFLFVPRLPGALWSMPNPNRAQTGLSDQLTPGSITELVQSDEPAFRVRFDGAPPPQNQRYWRGPVLHDFDGQTWTRGRFGVAQPFEPTGNAYDYEVILEPNGRNWWFGLETVASITGRGVRQTWDGQLISVRAVTGPTMYRARSYPQTRTTGALPRTTRYNDTALPPGPNPRTLQLATQLRRQSADDAAYVEAVLNYFRSNGFTYTLTPPPLQGDSIDALLFDTRQGFCGHFASAFTALMRAAGIPARVVTGYLGGEWNDIGDYLLVRQSDAHAWSEVWLDNSGWVRVDPTAVVSPQRLDTSVGDLLGSQLSTAARLRRDMPLLRNLLARWDATNHWWQERVLNFNQASQQGLLERMGFANTSYRPLIWLLMSGALAWALIALWALARARPPAAKGDALGKLWESLRDGAQRSGLTIAPHEAPRAIAQRIAMAWPMLAEPVADFTDQYLRLRYEPQSAPASAQMEAMTRALRRLRRGMKQKPVLDDYRDLAGRVPLHDRLPPNLRPRVA